MYQLVKPFAKLALFFYTGKVNVFKCVQSSYNESRILAANHPNSFFDAIVLAVIYPKPIYFLARGDAFKKPLVASILKSLHLIPIYRLSEGIENLNKNEDTFQTCVQFLKENKTILIFSEGVCVNEWKLRPLKKGTSRLGLLALENGISNTKIQPTILNYSSFSKVPKDIAIHFEQDILLEQIDFKSPNEFYRKCNLLIEKRLKNSVIEKENIKEVKLFPSNRKPMVKTLVAIPAFVGYLSQYWFYKLIQKFAYQKTKNTVFYDSILFGLLLFLYPIFVLLLSLLFLFIFDYKIAVLVFIFLPITAYCYKSYKSLI